MQETRVQSLGQEDPLEEEVAAHSSLLTWRIPWTEEPGGLHRPWGRKASDRTESMCKHANTHTHTHTRTEALVSHQSSRAPLLWAPLPSGGHTLGCKNSMTGRAAAATRPCGVEGVW